LNLERIAELLEEPRIVRTGDPALRHQRELP
jgi:hypothetical protein